jgi:2-polyprenyl-6-methoxyphenol hydroxylase-like FAD-dependent oxidoreductase
MPKNTASAGTAQGVNGAVDPALQRVSNICYRRGHVFATVVANGEHDATLRLTNGSEHRFDLVLFTDGYQSLGRAALFPERRLSYRGYLLWRGLLREADLAGGARSTWISLDRAPGHLQLPGPHGLRARPVLQHLHAQPGGAVEDLQQARHGDVAVIGPVPHQSLPGRGRRRLHLPADQLALQHARRAPDLPVFTGSGTARTPAAAGRGGGVDGIPDPLSRRVGPQLGEAH